MLGKIELASESGRSEFLALGGEALRFLSSSNRLKKSRLWFLSPAVKIPRICGGPSAALDRRGPSTDEWPCTPPGTAGHVVRQVASVAARGSGLIPASSVCTF